MLKQPAILVCPGEHGYTAYIFDTPIAVDIDRADCAIKAAQVARDLFQQAIKIAEKEKNREN